MKLEPKLAAVLEPLRVHVPEPERAVQFSRVLDQTTGMPRRRFHV